MEITGIATIRNALEVSYPFIECFLSIYPIVDELLINDGGSDDGTLQYLERMEDIFHKIKIYNIPDYMSDHWDCVDDQINQLLKQARGDWIVEIQADEAFHENDLSDVLSEIHKAHNGYNGIRHRRIEVFNLVYNPHCYDYRVVRIVRNRPDLVSRWGGDDFRFGDEVSPREGYTSHNVHPEYDSDIVFYHFTQTFYNDAYLRAKRHASYLATKQDIRQEVLSDYTDFMAGGLIRDYPKPAPELPILMRTVRDHSKDKYVPRESLFDPEWLHEMTGMKYV